MRACVARFSRDFSRDRSGVVAVIFALILVPLLLTVRLSIDYGYASSVSSSVQKALDAAVLDGARELARSRDADKAEAAAERRFAAADLPDTGIVRSFSADARRGTITATASGGVRTSFLPIVGITELPVHAEAAASAGPNEASSRSGKAQAARAAAESALSRLGTREVDDLIERVTQACYRVAQMGFAEKVPQCQSVFNGSFETELRAKLASSSDVSTLLPAGVRLTK